MKLPNIVQGNDFKMAVNVYTVEVVEGKEIKKDFDVSTSTDIKVYLVKSNNANGCIDKYEVPFEISEEDSNVIYISIKGINLPLGSYGLEITGVDQYEYHWRFKAKIGELFNIVDATSASSYDNSTYIDFDASIGVIGNNLISEIEDIVTIMVDNLIGDIEGEIEDIQNDVETINQRIDSINTNLENKANKNELATVATTGNYNDLINKPNLFSGDYNDLTNKPVIPTVPTNVSAFINDAGYLTQHQSLANYVQFTDLASVATSGDYDDLINKPTIPVIPTNVSAFINDAGYLTEHQDLSAYALKTELFSGDYNDLTNKPTLFSGDYNDLTNKPTIPIVPTNVSAFINDAGYLTQHQSLVNYVQFNDLASVATSGDYDDLSNKPVIPVIPTNVSAFINDAGYLTQHQDLSAYALKTELFSGDYNDLTNKPTIPTVPTNVSAFINDAGYLTQHQSLVNYVQFNDLASVATSGDYDDLTNKPTIPTVPTNVSAFTNDAGYLTEHQDLSAYALKTDLFSGDYNDLTNKPTIPTVPTNVSAFINDAGYLTQHQSLANYYTKSEVDDKIENVEVDLDDYYTKYETDDLFIKDYSREYLTFESLEDNNVIGFIANDSSLLRTIQVSTDKTNWTSYTSSTGGTTLATLNTGDKLYVKGSNDYHANNNLFTSTKQFNVSGNIMSLIYGDNFIGQTTLTQSYVFSGLFNSCIHLINASNLILPATTLATYCYSSMFNSCTSLTTAPELPATTLAMTCYTNMFSDCPSLITAPELPATTLANGCYAYMFDGCTSLTTAPELPATTLVEACYNSMFYDCSSLNYIKAMFTNVDAGAGYMESWVYGVSSSGTFIKNKDAMWNVIGDDGIPTGWTVKSGDYAYESDLFSGNYNDLTNKPTIPTVPTNVSAFTNDAGYLTQHQSLANYVQFTDLASVATSGNYNDLTNKPNLFSGDYNDLTNKPTLFSGNYNDLTNKPTNVSSFTNDAGYLTQHQSLTNYVQFTDLASVATSGDYDDLTNKPTLFSGNYNDLTNKPTIPTVPTNVSAFTNDAGYLTQHQSLANYVSSTTSGLKIEVVSAMPANPQNNVLYIVQ